MDISWVCLIMPQAQSLLTTHTIGPLPDPAKFTGSAIERATLLNELYAMIRRRLEIFTSLPFASLDKMAVKARLDEIGDTQRVAP